MMLAIETAAFPTTDQSFDGPETADDAFSARVMTAKTRVVQRGEHVFLEGDRAAHIYKVEAGHVRVYRLLGDGRRHIIDFAFPGDFVGLGATGIHLTSAQATERTRLRCVPCGELRCILKEDPHLGYELFQKISHELAATRDLLCSVGQRSATERVAAFLLSLLRRQSNHTSKSSTFVLPMKRSDIADFLGLTLETVSRTFGKLRRQGVIELEQCVIVTVRDVAGLRAIAENGISS